MSDIVDRLRSQTDRLAQRYGATEVEDYPNDVDRWRWTCQDAADEARSVDLGGRRIIKKFIH